MEPLHSTCPSDIQPHFKSWLDRFSLMLSGGSPIPAETTGPKVAVSALVHPTNHRQGPRSTKRLGGRSSISVHKTVLHSSSQSEGAIIFEEFRFPFFFPRDHSSTHVRKRTSNLGQGLVLTVHSFLEKRQFLFS